MALTLASRLLEVFDVEHDAADILLGANFDRLIVAVGKARYEFYVEDDDIVVFDDGDICEECEDKYYADFIRRIIITLY
jgi:hypothetical protein